MAFVALAVPAAAQPLPLDTIDQTDLIGKVNEKSVLPALSVVTANQLNTLDAQGNNALVATAANGLKFEVNFRACDDAEAEIPEGTDRHCKAMYMISVWEALSPDQEADIQTALSAFLKDNPAINAGRLSDGAPYIVRYVIADYGTKQGNLVSEFANFIRSATDFQNTVSPFYPQ
ncbi:hypothetical protein FGU71_09865 [Erythrobacter insulae]|uniref:YbjN domain-containing protein n=1 Tax=Erythrobacter insulae TaxID=2584124 RepID=A0A547PDE0_9SPHN|nr:hypothetical protein [Erythrobacter insulae]TRD12135.1 hypothetical protein FGU71_09865 [Erythrobacter insulae]